MKTRRKQKVAKVVSVAVLGVAALGMLGLNSLLTAGRITQTTPIDTQATTTDTASIISTIPCLPANATTSATLAFSVHLRIVIDGTDVPIPANIGITKNCNYVIHTKDKSGRIYVTPPTPGTFTLGQFFALGGVPFSANQIFTKNVDISNTMTMTVNGAPNADFEKLILAKDQKIVITYGAAKIP